MNLGNENSKKTGKEMNPTKFDKPDQRYADDHNHKDVDAERHPEEQVIKERELKKEESKYNDKSVRV